MLTVIGQYLVLKFKIYFSLVDLFLPYMHIEKSQFHRAYPNMVFTKSRTSHSCTQRGHTQKVPEIIMKGTELFGDNVIAFDSWHNLAI
eukprot:Pgem_evm1s19916